MSTSDDRKFIILPYEEVLELEPYTEGMSFDAVKKIYEGRLWQALGALQLLKSHIPEPELLKIQTRLTLRQLNVWPELRRFLLTGHSSINLVFRTQKSVHVITKNLSEGEPLLAMHSIQKKFWKDYSTDYLDNWCLPPAETFALVPTKW